MSNVVAAFSNITTKMQVGVASVAIVAAATLTPAVVAQAQPGGLAPVAEVIGSHASGDPFWYLDNDANSLTSFAIPPAIQSIFQNQFFWFGTPNPTPPPGATVFVFTPLPLIPGFLRPLYGWFTQNLNFEACILGATLNVGPYGTLTGRLTQGC